MNQQNQNSGMRKFIFKADRHRAITPTFRLSFPSLFKATAFKDPHTGREGKPEFKATMIFDSFDALKADQKLGLSLARAVNNAKMDFFGSDPKKWPKLDYETFTKGEDHVSQKTGEIYEGYEGKIIAVAKSGEKYPPKILVAGRKELTPTENDVYAGCFCRAVIDVKPYYFARKYGVKLYLRQITKVKDGERFGGLGDFDFDDEGLEDGMTNDFSGGQDDFNADDMNL